MDRKIIIDEEIFKLFPDFQRALIIVKNLNNQPENGEIEEKIKQIIEKRKKEELINHPFILAWDEAHKKFNSNPNKFPPSIKSLIKRISKGGNLSFINSVVALFNYISIKYLMPCGGDDLEKIEGNLRLGLATGKETFLPLGSLSKEIEMPEAGEVIYFDDKTLKVMCRRWNWRNGEFSKITPETKKIIINLDALNPIPPAHLLKARDELAELLKKYCQADLELGLLKKENPNYFLAF